MTSKKEKLIRTTVQLSPHQHKALENLKSPGKSISAIVRTAIDLYLEPIYEQAYEDEKMDRMLSEMERLNEKLDQKEISMNDIFDDLKPTVK